MTKVKQRYAVWTDNDRAVGGAVVKSLRKLEINPGHAVISMLHDMKDPDSGQVVKTISFMPLTITGNDYVATEEFLRLVSESITAAIGKLQRDTHLKLDATFGVKKFDIN